MGQVLLQDKIGNLTESGGTISLAPSRLTIGGQQYSTSTLNIAADLSAANSRFQIYAVRDSGNTQLVISSNENSIGPAGFTVWKLVGSYYTNGLSTIGFGSFVNIEGTPMTNQAQFTPTFNNAGGWSINSVFNWNRVGDRIYINVSMNFSGSGSGTSVFSVNNPFPNFKNSISMGEYIIFDFNNNNQHLIGGVTNGASLFSFVRPGTTGSLTADNFTDLSYIRAATMVTVTAWSNTPIKDL